LPKGELKLKIALIGDSLTEGRPGVPFIRKLKERYPELTLVNLGKPGESVKSLHARLSKTKLDTDFDLSFLWIGVNDVYTKLLKVQAQPIAADQEEFRELYTKVLESVIASSKQVVAVTPGLVGEDMQNAPNQELKELSAVIQAIIRNCPNVEFLDIRSVFEKELAESDSSGYISTGVLTVMKEALFYKNPKRIDQLSEKRGLHLTLDGIHLNSRGAELVAEEFAAMIDRYL
jgi:lysophospholipase L1-like esterase